MAAAGAARRMQVRSIRDERTHGHTTAQPITFAAQSRRYPRRGRLLMSQQPSTLAGTSAQTWAIVVWALFLASILSVAFTAIIGVIIAYIKRRDLAGTPF